MNASGTRIAFSASSNLTGENPDYNNEIFLVDTTTRAVTQLTHSTGNFNGFPAINANGTRIAFASAEDLTGENPDPNAEIFLVHSLTRAVTQLTHSTEGENLGPVINASGTRIAFPSFSDLTGENPDGNIEIFLAQCDFGAQATTLCATLGDNPRSARRDLDLFRFRGTAGEQVVVTLGAAGRDRRPQ
jgi:Tol biopolymer transport system component